MNTYTRNFNAESSLENHSGQVIRTGFAGFAVRISLLLLLIFSAIAAQMHLRVSIERLNKHATRIQSEIRQLNVQYTNLRNKKETLTSWPNIHAKIRQYRLELREADHRQISYITLDSPRGVSRTLRPSRPIGQIRKRNEYAQSGR